MKKILLASIALTFCVASSQTLFAGTAETNNSGGLTLRITDTSGANPTGEELAMAMSPGVVINAYTVANAFALSTANANANANNRIEYGIWSSFSGYYQRSNPNVAVTFTTAEMLYPADTVDPAGTASPFAAGWTAIGDDSGS